MAGPRITTEREITKYILAKLNEMATASGHGAATRLSEALGMERTSVHRMLKGKNAPKSSVLAQISIFYGVPINHWFPPPSTEFAGDKWRDLGFGTTCLLVNNPSGMAPLTQQVAREVEKQPATVKKALLTVLQDHQKCNLIPKLATLENKQPTEPAE